MNLKRKLSFTLPAVAAAALTLSQVGAVGAQSLPVGPGGVIALQGTEHLWVVDDQGLARLAGDSQALSRVPVNWTDREEATRAALEAQPRGAPLLSANLVKIGDAVYLPEFDVNGGAPTLRHIQSVDDLALLGVNAGNYGQLILDRQTWEQRYGFDTDTLQRDDFRTGAAPAAGSAQPSLSTAEESSSETASDAEVAATTDLPVIITVPPSTSTGDTTETG
jgi:hypothetical protein